MSEQETSMPVNYGLFYLLIFVLLGWSVFDFGGRYLHVQVISQGITAGLLILTALLYLRRQDQVQAFPLALPLALWVGSFILSFVFSVNQLASLEEIFRILMYLSVAFVVFHISRDKAPTLFAGFIALGLAVCLFGWLTPFNERLVSTFYRTNDLAGYLLLLFPLSLHLFIREKKMGLRLFYGGATLVFVVSFLYTYSRSAWASGLVALLVVVLANFKSLKSKSGLLFAAGMFVVLAGAVYFNWEAFTQRLGTLSHLYQDNSANWRLDLYQVAWRIFLDHPIVGSGPNTYGIIFPTYQLHPGYFSINAHNYYLQLLAEQGVLGLGAFLIFMGSAFWVIFQSQSEYKAGVLASLSGGLVHIAFDIDWSVAAIPIAFFFLLGMGLQGAQPRSKQATVFPMAFRLGAMSLVAFLLAVLPGMNYFSAKAHAESQQAFGSDELEQAEAKLQQAIGLAPWPSARHYISLGQLYLKQKEYKRALFSLTKAVHLSPHHADAYRVLAGVFLAQNKPTEAMAVLKSRVALNPMKHPSFYGDVGDLYFQQDQWREAVEWYKKGISMFPSNRLGHYERYTPKDRYELFMLYQHLAQAEQVQGDTKASAEASQTAQALMQTAANDLLTETGTYPNPVSALKGYWQEVALYLETGKKEFQSVHPQHQLSLPPRSFQIQASKIEFVSAQRTVQEAFITYRIPARVNSQQAWGRLVFQDRFVPFQGSWTLYQRKNLGRQ